MQSKEDVERVHDKLREILISYGSEEYGDCIIDDISRLFDFPTTTYAKCLFEDYENLPDNVNEVIAAFNRRAEEGEIGVYVNCQRLVAELEEIGWTCDYYLDAEPFNLRELK